MNPGGNRFLRRTRRLIVMAAPRLARRAAFVAIAILAVFLAFRAAAPLLISTHLVRSNLEEAVTQWTGHRTIIKGAPSLEFWPVPRITLNDVVIEQSAPSGAEVVGRVESLSASFSVIAAWQGVPEFYDFHFVRPEFTVMRDASGNLHWSDEGLLANAIRETTPDASGRQSLASDLDARIGSVTIDAGTLIIKDAGRREPYRLEGISADIEWPRLGAGLRAHLIARIHGRDVRLDLATSQPLLLYSGKNADTKGSFTSGPLNVNFEGVANLASPALLAGTIDINAPDIPALVEWTGLKLPALSALHSATMNAEVATIDDNLRLNNLRFTIDDAQGTGVLALAMSPAGTPKATGTLAFDHLDIGAFLAAFSIHAPTGTLPENTIDTSFLRQVQLDLRLSAASADLGPFRAADIGASVLINEKQARFDIADSAFEGGRLSGHLVVAEQTFDGRGDLQISVRDANLGDIFQRLNLVGPLPHGAGSLNLALHTDKPVWATGTHDISGTFRLSAEGGTLQNFDVTAFRSLSTDVPFFYLSAAGNGSFAYTSADIAATFANGAAELTQTRFVGAEQTISLTGVIPYETSSLALAGALQATDPTQIERFPPINFFVGGSWPDPVITAMPVNSPPAPAN